MYLFCVYFILLINSGILFFIFSSGKVSPIVPVQPKIISLFFIFCGWSSSSFCFADNFCETISANFSKDLYYDPIYSPVFESKINDLGYWRLSTSKYLIHHIGNNLDKLNEELELTSQGRYKLKSNHSQTVPEKKSKMKIRFYRHPLVRRFLKSIYSKIYKLLYEI